MPYEYLDDVAIADIAFKAWGKTKEDMFLAAAEATLKVMIDNLEDIAPQQEIEIILDDETLEMLLLKFLQEFIFYKDAQNALFKPYKFFIKEDQGRYHLKSLLKGEEINRNKHQLHIDVKAVTLCRLEVIETSRGFEATVVLDV